MAEKEPEPTYGGLEGPTAEYLKLISSDGHEFIIKKDVALVSGTINAMLSGPGEFKENEINEITFREIPSHILMMVCRYFHYRKRFSSTVSDLSDFPVPPEMAVELLMAANFLDC